MVDWATTPALRMFPIHPFRGSCMETSRSGTMATSHPHRTRQHGRTEGPGGCPVGRQTQRAVAEFSDQGLAHAAWFIPRCGAGQGGRGPRQCMTGRLDRFRHAVQIVRRWRGATVATTRSFRWICFQTGSGTSTNMNVNEVIARLARARTLGGRCTPTIMSTWARAATTSSRPPCISPRRKG